MPLDAITLRALTEELRPQLLNLRIDKVQQPARDQVILLLRGNKRLLLNAGANAPRLQLTELLRDNPAEPPMFCMLLRKHLVGARVADITQPGLERLVRIELDVTDDFGQPGHRTLVLEAMGRRSNLILLDGEGSASDKFWKLEERIKKDKRHPGVLCEVSKENMIFDIVTLINSGVINIADLAEFSDGLKESVDLLLHRLQADG